MGTLDSSRDNYVSVFWYWNLLEYYCSCPFHFLVFLEFIYSQKQVKVVWASMQMWVKRADLTIPDDSVSFGFSIQGGSTVVWKFHFVKPGGDDKKL